MSAITAKISDMSSSYIAINIIPFLKEGIVKDDLDILIFQDWNVCRNYLKEWVKGEACTYWMRFTSKEDFDRSYLKEFLDQKNTFSGLEGSICRSVIYKGAEYIIVRKHSTFKANPNIQILEYRLFDMKLKGVSKYVLYECIRKNDTFVSSRGLKRKIDKEEEYAGLKIICEDYVEE